jgi:glycosyltransferase involved in cell wall biosynthesis
VNRLKGLVQDQQIKNVIFLPQMQMNEVGSLLQAADILLVHLKNDPLFEITIPSKTQAYLAIGRPILMAVKGDAADLITQAKSGYCVEPENVDSITKAILEMATLPPEVLNQMGANGKDFYHKNLSLNIGVGKFLKVFASMVNNS